MIRKSGYRFSEKIMLKRKDRARRLFDERTSAGSAENDQGGHTRSIEGIQDAACSHFGNERVIESIFVITTRHSRQTFPSNVGPEAFSQKFHKNSSCLPDAVMPAPSPYRKLSP